MNSWRRRIVLALALIVASLLVTGLVLYWKVRRVPAFYQQAEVADPQQQAASHTELLEKVEQLKKDVRFSLAYKISLTEEQLNSWLAENHDSSSDPFYRPRLAIHPDVIQIACRARYKSWQTVISAQLTVEMTGRQNVIRVHVTSIQAGSLSIGWDRVIDLLRQTVERTGFETNWQSGDGEATVEITVPSRWAQSPRQLVIESIQLTEGEITLRGRAE
tara:strand:- start:564 stop:1217 length:654 start_codon:yes stop_codon:yes gene_type:complete